VQTNDVNMRKIVRRTGMQYSKRFFVLLAFVFFLSSIASANGLNLNGFGSRAVAMGGAFVGLADDYSAIFWNPAGIAQFSETTMGMTGDLIMPSASYELEMLGVKLVDAEMESKIYPSGLAGFFHPISDKFVAGIGVYTPSGLGAKWDGKDFAPITQGMAYKWESYIGVISISPALAYKINEYISVGASLNLNYGFFNIDRHAGTVTIPTNEPPYSTIFNLGQYSESSSGWGVSGTLGVLVKPNEMFSFGATVRTPSQVTMSGKAEIPKLQYIDFPAESDFERDVTSPMWVAGGVAFHPTQNLTFTFDAQYTNWLSLDVLDAEFDNQYWQVMMKQSGGSELELNWEDAVQLRFGAEYQLGNVFLRGGYYRDPAPAPDETMNVLLPSYTFNAFTFGLGYGLESLEIGAALEYLIGEEREIAAAVENEQPGIYNMSVLTPILSIVFHW
jgi:long-chain fatty acid transport protein